jgi:hypothetical protein
MEAQMEAGRLKFAVTDSGALIAIAVGFVNPVAAPLQDVKE